MQEPSKRSSSHVSFPRTVSLDVGEEAVCGRLGVVVSLLWSPRVGMSVWSSLVLYDL